MSDDVISATLGLRTLAEVRDTHSPSELPLEQSLTEYQGDIPAQPLRLEQQLPEVPEPDKDTLRDIELARENIVGMLKTGADSMDTLSEIAKATESARAYEVLSAMMKTMLEANRELVNMAKERKYEKTEQPSQHATPATTNVTNNNLIMSTSEILRLLKNGGE